jgi:hypothetical protein
MNKITQTQSEEAADQFERLSHLRGFTKPNKDGNSKKTSKKVSKKASKKGS